MPEEKFREGVNLFVTALALSLEATLDPDSQKALLDDIHRRAHDPRALGTQNDALLQTEVLRVAGALRVAMMILRGEELD